MNDRKYFEEFKKYKNNKKLYKMKYNKLIEYTIFISFVSFIITGILASNDFIRIEFLGINLFISIFCTLSISILYLLSNIKIIKFRNYTYNGKLSDLFDISHPAVKSKADVLRRKFEEKNGFPSYILCDIQDDIDDKKTENELKYNNEKSKILNELNYL